MQALAREKEALEQQRATAEILKVISSSPSDVQPVFDSIIANAVRLCGALFGAVYRFEGGLIDLEAWCNFSVEALETVRRRFPQSAADESLVARSIRMASVISVPDIAADPSVPAGSRTTANALGYRSQLTVPLLRDGAPIGAIVVAHKDPGSFPAQQVALLRMFADQAVIAIENARLFKETKEALEQQTATSEILGVISRSPSDLTPVFDAILKSALQLCEAHLGHLHLYDGEIYRTVAQRGATAEFAKYIAERGPYKSQGGVARATAERRPVHEPDLKMSPGYLAGAPNTVKFVELGGARTALNVPLLKDDKVLGVLVIYRPEVRPFTERQIALVSLFANQAVIAMENARLFNETRESLERQTATAEILKVIASSPSDVQPVFETIIRNAVRLCDGAVGAMFRYDGSMVHVGALYNLAPKVEKLFRSAYPQPLSRENPGAHAILERGLVSLEDVEATDYSEAAKERARGAGYRGVVAVPLMREGMPIGSIAVGRRVPGKFPDSYVALLKTFAEQAVIAIENVRLFRELQERTEALTKSVDQLTALGEVGQAISSTLDLETVLKTIVSRAVQLTGLDAGAIYEYDEPTERFHLRASENISEELLETYRSTPIQKGDGAVGGTAVARGPIQVPETQDESYKSQFRDLIVRTGRRALLAVPLMHEEHIVGALAVQRTTPGPFSPEVVDLLKTFAAQSALAIQNAKLFREIQEKSAQLEVANKHKSDFLANMSHELRTPLNAIIGFSEALMDKLFGELNEKQADYLKDIHESGKHLLSLINDILDLSKIEAGHMELELSSFHLPTAISNAVTLIRERALRHGIALGVQIDERLGDVQADERKVKQVLLNLLSNAVKFTPDGGRVDVSARLDTDKVEISVKDTGVGISPEDQASLFEEFKQFGKDSSRKAEGTGLGLALSKRLVELHGGEIRVDSAVGHGSTFRVMLPSPTLRPPPSSTV